MLDDVDLSFDCDEATTPACVQSRFVATDEALGLQPDDVDAALAVLAESFDRDALVQPQLAGAPARAPAPAVPKGTPASSGHGAPEEAPSASASRALAGPASPEAAGAKDGADWSGARAAPAEAPAVGKAGDLCPSTCAVAGRALKAGLAATELDQREVPRLPAAMDAGAAA